jgi:hypothetical protein
MGVLLARTTDLLHDIGNNGLRHGSLRNRKLDSQSGRLIIQTNLMNHTIQWMLTRWLLFGLTESGANSNLRQTSKCSQPRKFLLLLRNHVHENFFAPPTHN